MHNEDSYNQNLHPWNGHNHIEKHLLITLLLWGVWHTQNETKQNRYATAFCNFKIPAGILSSLTRFPHLHGTSEGQVQRAPWQTPTAESHTSALWGYHAAGDTRCYLLSSRWFMMSLTMVCSRTLQVCLSWEIGLYLDWSKCSPFLKTGATWASFQFDGTAPVWSEDGMVIISEGINWLQFLDVPGATPCGLVGLLGFHLAILFFDTLLQDGDVVHFGVAALNHLKLCLELIPGVARPFTECWLEPLVQNLSFVLGFRYEPSMYFHGGDFSLCRSLFLISSELLILLWPNFDGTSL